MSELTTLTANSGLATDAWTDADFAIATGRGVTVGVIDSGRDPEWNEPRIRPGVGLVASRGFAVSRSLDDTDRIGHGTACCDLILRSAPGVVIHPVRVFHRRLETSVEVLVEALRWAVSQRLRVINLSLGTHLESALRPLYKACEQARRRGVIVVSAVNVQSGASYPAVFDSVIGVQAGAVDQPFEYRPGDAVECVARGSCRARGLQGQISNVTGSSFAAPQVTALVARLLESRPDADVDRVRALLARVAGL